MILVVDDDPLFLDKAREILNRARRVFFASTSRQAFKLAKDLGFSVVLVDLNLKGEDGIALIRSLKEKFPGLPIIAISESVQKAAADLAAELESGHCVPVPLPELAFSNIALVANRVNVLVHVRRQIRYAGGPRSTGITLAPTA